MSKTEGAPQKYAALYVSEDIEERAILGVVFKFRHLSGPELLKMADQQQKGSEVIRTDYIKVLFDASCVEPKDLDLNRMSPDAMIQLVQTMEDVQGLGKLAAKNSK